MLFRWILELVRRKKKTMCNLMIFSLVSTFSKCHQNEKIALIHTLATLTWNNNDGSFILIYQIATETVFYFSSYSFIFNLFGCRWNGSFWLCSDHLSIFSVTVLYLYFLCISKSELFSLWSSIFILQQNYFFSESSLILF